MSPPRSRFPCWATRPVTPPDAKASRDAKGPVTAPFRWQNALHKQARRRLSARPSVYLKRERRPDKIVELFEGPADAQRHPDRSAESAAAFAGGRAIRAGRAASGESRGGPNRRHTWRR